MTQRARKAREARPNAGQPAARSKPPETPGAAGSAPNRPELSFPKKALFSTIVLVLLLGATEGILAVCGVRPAARTSDPYAGFAPHTPHFALTTQADGTRLVTVSPAKKDVLNTVPFPARKPPGGFRILCLGGSSTYGRPFFDATSYPGFLRAFLPAADPSRTWEVINAGAISYASYRVQALLEELLPYEPDLVVIDVGHNEFLERRTYANLLATPGWIRAAGGLVRHTRTATVLETLLTRSGLIRPASPQAAGTQSSRSGLSDEVVRIPLNTVGPEAYHRDPEFQRQVLAHFQASLERMIELARAAGARVLLIAPAANLRDFAPFKSEHRAGLATAQLQAWDEAYLQGRALIARGDARAALRALERALAIDDAHADLHYRHGQALAAEGRMEEARSAFLRARDLDICPLRAGSETLDVIRNVARERQVPLLDAESAFTARAPHGLIDETQFTDHVHMQMQANADLARDLVDSLAALGVIHPSAGWDAETAARIAREVEQGIDRPLWARELRTLSQLLDYLGQTEQALHRIQEALRLAPADPEALALGGKYAAKLGRTDEAEALFRQALQKRPDLLIAREGLGGIVLDQGQPREALELLEPVLRAAPDSVSARNQAGIACSLLGRNAEAIAHFQHAIGKNPRDAAIRRNLGLAHERAGQATEALIQFRAALQLAPQDPQIRADLDRLARTAAPGR
jgi:tetratricopeptide (TPR) repeat protein